MSKLPPSQLWTRVLWVRKQPVYFVSRNVVEAVIWAHERIERPLKKHMFYGVEHPGRPDFSFKIGNPATKAIALMHDEKDYMVVSELFATSKLYATTILEQIQSKANYLGYSYVCFDKHVDSPLSEILRQLGFVRGGSCEWRWETLRAHTKALQRLQRLQRRQGTKLLPTVVGLVGASKANRRKIKETRSRIVDSYKGKLLKRRFVPDSFRQPRRTSNSPSSNNDNLKATQRTPPRQKRQRPMMLTWAM